MGAAAYVGRVGGLAVALGVGAAMATGQGVASASPTESTSSASESSASASSEETGSGTTPDTNSTDNTPKSEVSSEAKSSTPTSRGALKSAATRIAELGKALSTGGALTSKKVTKGAEQAGSLQAESDKAADADAAVVADDADVVAPEESEEAIPPVPTRTPPKIIDVVTSKKKSSSGPADKPAEGSISRVPAPKSAVEVRTVDVVAAKDVMAEKSADSVLQRTASAVEPTTFRSLSSLTATQDAPEAMMSAPDAPAAQAPLPQLVTNVLSVFGLGSLASDVPGVPGGSPFALALLAVGARRETEQTFSTLARTTTTSGTPVAAATLTGPPTAAVTAAPVGPVAVSPNTDFVEYVTGANSPNDTLNRFNIGGTDLGIMWDNGIKDNPATTDVNEHQVLIAFGDTFRDPVNRTDWRMNTLFRSYDNTLSNGMDVPAGIIHNPGTYSGSPMSNPNWSREIIGNYHYGIGPEITMIPTAAISVPGAGAGGATRQYINFMAVRSWDTPGRWTTNYSAIAYSDDNGQNWTVVPPSSVRPAAAGRSTLPFVAGNQNFQQFAYVKGAVVDANGVPVNDPVTGQPKTDGYVYAYGTPSGRGGTAYLSRVKEGEILDQTKYQYWNGSTWVVNTPAAATPILPGTTTGFWIFKRTTYPTVGEMSVQYNAYEKKYIMLYADQNNNVVMRKADKPEGPWSAPTTLVTSTQKPGLYAPMIHPWSGTDNLSAAEQQYLFWNLSTWGDYQVQLMRTDLSKV